MADANQHYIFLTNYSVVGTSCIRKGWNINYSMVSKNLAGYIQYTAFQNGAPNEMLIVKSASQPASLMHPFYTQYSFTKILGSLIKGWRDDMQALVESSSLNNSKEWMRDFVEHAMVDALCNQCIFFRVLWNNLMMISWVLVIRVTLLVDA